jgi:hypothetical protein
VSFSATATDNVGVVSLTCSPASGSTFGLGTTTVTCTAMDVAGNTASASFNVTVIVNASSIGTLIDGIEGMGLSKGVTRSLTGMLQQSPNNNAMCGKLNAFLNIVANRLAQGQLTAAQADLLTQFAQAIQDSIGCS